jgi:hypothetical protein
MLPPGRAKLVTKPAPIGSDTLVNTIGIASVNAARKAIVNGDVAVLRPSKLFERLAKC